MAGLDEQVRGPLNAIRGLSELLCANHPSVLLPRGVSQDLDQIRNAARTVSRTCDLAAAYGDLDAGVIETDCRGVDLSWALRRSLKDIQSDARARRVEIHGPLNSASDVWALADPERLQQVLHALLSNAVRFTPTGGAVVLELARNESRVTLTIQDTGPGIPESLRPALFQPFAACAVGETQPGLGLGLAWAHRMAGAMGGSLCLANGTGTGACLRLSLAAAATRPAAVRDEGRAPSLHGRHILCIEPDEADRLVFRRLLTGMGAQLYVATSAAEGLAAARALHPDLILLTLELPDGDGFSTKANLDGDATTSAIPVVGITRRACKSLWREGVRAGFASWATKPIDLDLLQRSVVRLVDPPRSIRAVA